VALHQIEHQIAPIESAVWIHDRGIGRSPNEGGKQCGFGQSQLAYGSAEIKFRGRLKSIIAVCQIDLIGIHGENLLLGIVALDLDGEKSLLDLSAETAVRAIKKKAAG